jgi:outer membrane DcaP-like protein
MKQLAIRTFLAAGMLIAISAVAARAADPEIEELKNQIKALNQKVLELEQKKAAEPAPAATNTNKGEVTVIAPETKEIIGHASPVADRAALNDQQTAAPRPNDLTLDPKYRGFIPIPNTPALIKFNAKPRVDFTSDNRNSGNPDRFVTAQIPVQGESGFGGSEQFNVNSRGSQLGLDVRAPDMPGNFRFYYQNDFFGSSGNGNSMNYRLRQLYGQLYNVTAGFTYSVFEDPDVWPDTVDYEGPNSAIFARRPLVRYMVPIDNKWQINIGVEQPGSEVDGGPNDISQVNRAPDGGLNLRWEDAKAGHVQFAAIFRDIGARGATGTAVGNQNVFGWGLNLSSVLNVLERDSVQGQLTYGEGIFRYCNDDFANNDAAYDSSGNLKALPYFGAMAGYTHHWNDTWRSTGSFGYVHLDNETSQGPNAYHQTYYGSANVVWQIRRRMSIGLEGLYGYKEEQSAGHGDDWRIQLSTVFALFD